MMGDSYFYKIVFCFLIRCSPMMVKDINTQDLGGQPGQSLVLGSVTC